jgi:hypothetical protein
VTFRPRHHDTWLHYLLHMVTSDAMQDPRALAEILSIAAPDGPHGYQCVDTCRCENADNGALRVIEALADQGTLVPPGLHYHVKIGLLKDGHRMVERVAHLLAQWRVIISDRNALVAWARNQYPETWKAVRSLIS